MGVPNGVKDLPFQYQQRARELKDKDKDTAAALNEQRDQQLENYLANLHGGAQISLVILSAGTIDGGGSTLGGSTSIPDWSVFIASENLHYASGTLSYTGSGTPGDMLAIVSVSGTIGPIMGEAPGFLDLQVYPGQEMGLTYVDFDRNPTHSFTKADVLFESLSTVISNVNAGLWAPITGYRLTTDFLTSTVPVTGAGDVLYAGGTTFVYLVE